ncbi:MAG: alpha/beta hydrolase [Victivallaceae bacterium]
MIYIILTGIGIIYLLLAALLYIFQKHFVFQPGKTIFATPKDVGIDFEDIWLKTSDDIALNCWLVPAANAEYTVLFCHGNGGSLAHRIGTIELFHQLGVNFFVFDYRGYGKSGGHVSEKGLYKDSETAWNYLTETRKIPAEKIIVVGRSLGGAMAARLAAQKNPGGLILESAFLSIPEMGRDIYPFFPVAFLAKYKFPTVDFLKKTQCPALVVATANDEIVKFRHGKALFDAAPTQKTFLELSSSHDECYFICWEKYTVALKTFFASLS